MKVKFKNVDEIYMILQYKLKLVNKIIFEINERSLFKKIYHKNLLEVANW